MGRSPEHERFVAVFAFTPLLEKAATPRVVFMGSKVGSITLALDPRNPLYGWANGSYDVSKAALNMVAVQICHLHKEKKFKVNVVDPGFRQTSMNGYSKMAGKAEDGAVEACRIITQGKDGQYNTFTSDDGEELPW